MSYESYKASNNAQGQPVGALSAGSTTLILTTGQGARFPSVYPYLLNIEERNATSPFAVTKREMVKVTNRVGDTFTIVRSAGTCLPDDSSNTQGTTAFSFSNPSRTTVTLGITAEVIEDINTELALKLTRNGGLRTGLTANSIVSTNASGNEVLLAPTAGHVVGFTGGGVPTTFVPTVDINSLSSVTTIADSDETIFYISGTGNRKITKSNLKNTLFPFIGAKAIGGSTFTLTNDTYSTIVFASEEFDTDTMHDNVTNNSRVTIKTAGYYDITGGFCDVATDWNFSSSAEFGSVLSIYKNGVEVSRTVMLVHSVIGIGGNLNVILNLAVNDYLELVIRPHMTTSTKSFVADSKTFLSAIKL